MSTVNGSEAQHKSIPNCVKLYSDQGTNYTTGVRGGGVEGWGMIQQLAAKQ